MKNILVTKFRLVRVLQTQTNEDFTISFADYSTHNYGPDYRDEEEFDTHEEALTHAINSEKWHNMSFTILPIYNIYNQ